MIIYILVNACTYIHMDAMHEIVKAYAHTYMQIYINLWVKHSRK